MTEVIPGEMLPGWTIVPPLISAVLHTHGPILELGVGWYSTPVLHEFATALGRRHLCVESGPHWGGIATTVVGADNIRVGQYDDIVPLLAEEHWGLVLLDHGPDELREMDMARLKGVSDVILVHDRSRSSVPFTYAAFDNRYPPPTLIVSMTDPLAWAAGWTTPANTGAEP